MAEFVGGGEDPALHRDPLPGVHDHRRPPVFRPDAESEERVPPGLQREHLDAVLLQEAAEVGYGRVRREADRLPGGAGDRAGARRRVEAPGGPEPEVGGVVEAGFQEQVAVEPLRHFGEDLFPAVHPGARPEPHGAQRPHREHQVAEGYAERLREGFERPGPRGHSAALDPPDGGPGQPGLRGEAALGEAAVEPQPGEVGRDAAGLGGGRSGGGGGGRHDVSTLPCRLKRDFLGMGRGGSRPTVAGPRRVVGAR